MFKRLTIFNFFLFLWLPYTLCARQIETFYGHIEVEEPVLLELIDSSAFQRLKHVHQYGVAYYTTHREEYNRYDHSLGVFTILRSKGASLEAQIAGLLHDVSHTAFSHVGDWIFGIENQEKSYQDEIHTSFLEKRGLGEILKKHGFTIDQILPKEELFPALDTSLPNLCADRIDYNIQGAYYQNFITYDEAILIFNDISFTGDRWVSRHPELIKKLAYFSFFMTQDCWGSPANYVTSRWLADAILRAIDIGCVSYEELHFGTDDEIWNKLILQQDPIIAKKMEMVQNYEVYFSIVDFTDKADLIVKSKFRGINPYVLIGYKCFRISEIDSDLAAEYEKAKQIVQKGWPIKLHDYDGGRRGERM